MSADTIIVREFSSGAMGAAAWNFDVVNLKNSHKGLSGNAVFTTLLPGESSVASKGYWVLFGGKWRSYVITNLGSGRVEIRRKRWRIVESLYGQGKKTILVLS